MNRTPSTELVGSRTRILPPDQILAFFTFAVVAAVTPGPSNVLVMAAGAHVGLWRGLHCLAGVVVGMALLMGVAVLGLGSLVEAYPWWTAALKWCGSAFLLWMAWRIATAPPMRTGSDPDPVGFWRALAFQWINPKSWIVSASAAGTFAAGGSASAGERALTLAAIFALAAAPSCGLWLAFGAAVRRWLANERASRAFNVTMGVLLALSVLLIMR